MRKFAIILAGGDGLRAGGVTPKQFRNLCGYPMVWWSMKAFKESFPEMEVILVMHPGFFTDWDLMIEDMPEDERIPHYIVCGGRTRVHSVKNGLIQVRDILKLESEENPGLDNSVVFIHDGARPLVNMDMIRRGMSSLKPSSGCVPAIALTDSIRELRVGESHFGEKIMSVSVERRNYMAVQTPQIFYFNDIMNAYEAIDSAEGFTDDASIAESAGMKIILYSGDTENIKVTYPIDFEIASLLLNKRFIK